MAESTARFPESGARYGALPIPRLTPALQALIGTGRIFSLQQALRPDMPQWAAQPAYRLTNVVTHDESASMMSPPVTGSFERIEHSGHSGTHIDALCHVGCIHDGQPFLHGEIPARAVQSTHGFGALGAEHFPPILLRGILLDLPGVKGTDCLPDLYAVTVEDLQYCEREQGVRIEPGTAVLIRTGFERFWRGDPARYMGAGPGPGVEAARYVAERGAVTTGSDTANYEVLAFPELPAHSVLLYEYGIPIMENLHLDELATARCYEFLFVALPIAYSGASGSNIHPIVIA